MPNDSEVTKPFTLYLPDGTPVLQGSHEDRATWWTCSQCGFTGPHVGTNARTGAKRCLGIFCDGDTENPNVPRATRPA